MLRDSFQMGSAYRNLYGVSQVYLRCDLWISKRSRLSLSGESFAADREQRPWGRSNGRRWTVRDYTSRNSVPFGKDMRPTVDVSSACGMSGYRQTGYCEVSVELCDRYAPPGRSRCEQQRPQRYVSIFINEICRNKQPALCWYHKK